VQRDGVFVSKYLAIGAAEVDYYFGGLGASDRLTIAQIDGAVTAGRTWTTTTSRRRGGG
jgi:hypothetical protein